MTGHLYCTVKLCDLTTELVTYIAVKLYFVTLQDDRSLILYCKIMWPYDRASHSYCCKVVLCDLTGWQVTYFTVTLCDLTTGLVTYIAVKLYCVTLQDDRSLTLSVKLCDLTTGLVTYDLTTGLVTYIAVKLYCVTLHDDRSLMLYCCRSICISSKRIPCYLWHAFHACLCGAAPSQ